MSRALDLRRLLRIAAAYVIAWIGVAVFITSQAHRVDVAFGPSELYIWHVFAFELASALLWATFTPIIVAIAERIEFQAHKIRDAVILVASVPLLAIGRALIGGALLTLAEDGRIKVSILQMSVGLRSHTNLFRILIIIALTRLACAWNESRARERRASALSATLTRARIDELHTRVQPEFLTHTLRVLGDRIRRGDPAAETLLVALSDLLHQVLLVARHRSTLEGELDLLDRYLLFREMLSGKRIETRYEFGEELLAAEVPMMMLQPLLEEAIGGAAAETLHITLRGRQDGGTVTLEVEDDAGATPRVEIARVRERVKTFLAGATFDADARGRVHTTRIALPLAAAGAS